MVFISNESNEKSLKQYSSEFLVLPLMYLKTSKYCNQNGWVSVVVETGLV
jgi:hypothetical protein